MRFREMSLGEIVKLADKYDIDFSIRIRREGAWIDYPEDEVIIETCSGSDSHMTRLYLDELNETGIKEAEDKLCRTVDEAVAWHKIKREEALSR